MIFTVINAIFEIVYGRLKTSSDLAILVPRSHLLSYEDTDAGSWAFVDANNEPVRNV